MRGVLWSIETGNLPALWEQLQSGLTIRGASPNTIARHRMHIGRLDQFMRRRGMTYYSPEIGAMFMNDDIPNDEPSTFENNRGTITQLNLVFNGKEITAKGRTFNPEVFIGPLAPIFQKFCETVCPTDVSEMKLYEYTRYGAEFLSYAV